MKLEKYKLYYEAEVEVLGIEDRKGMNSIENERTGKTESSTILSILVSGVYKEKIDKALKHLSNICYQKYGSKKRELF